MINLIAGFIIGIFIGSLSHVSLVLIFSIFTLSLVFFIYKKFTPEEHKSFVVYGVFLLFGVGLGFIRIYFSDLNQESKLVQYENKYITAEGIVVSEPDVRETNTKLTVKLINVSDKKFSEKILLTVSLYPEYSYGDKIKIEHLKLQKPKKIESDSGRVFDYSGYLRVRGIWYTTGFAKVSLVEHGHGSIIKEKLFIIKKKFTESISKAIPEPESSLMAGLLLGTKQSLGKDLLNEFSRTGVSHIVVLSGYNIAIVAESIMSVLKFLPSTLSFSFGCIGIILFTILSGGGASAVRAAIMVLVALFAKKFNRDYKASRALGFAIVLMLAGNPTLLVFDPSFQLSALATIGLVFVSPYVTPYLSKVTEKFGLREIISSTIATQITVLPFLIYNTGILSLVALPVNILILGTIPTTMFFGFLTGLFGFLSYHLSLLPALVSYILLWYQLTVVHIGSSLSFGAVTIPVFSPFILVCLYIAICFALYIFSKKIKPH